jgi:hypothetical protein
MSFNIKKNTDNVFVRNIIAGLIKLLNNQIFYENVKDGETDIVQVPFFYSFTGDERYLQDYFLNWNDCNYPKKLEGNIDPIPRGSIQLGDFSIDTSGLTQRWIRGQMTKTIQNKTETFNAYINSIALKIGFEVTVKADGVLESFKIIQGFLDTFYKVRVYNVEYKGMMIPCQVSFPESYSAEKTFEFEYPAERFINMTVSLEIETYYPVVDEPNLGSSVMRDLIDGNMDITQQRLTDIDIERKLTRKQGTDFIEGVDNLSSKTSSIRNSSNVMSSLLIGKESETGNFNNYKNKGSLVLLSPLVGETYYSGKPINIKWEKSGWIDELAIYYSLDYGTTWIESNIGINASLESYEWIVPELTNILDGIVVFGNVPKRQAKISLLADALGAIYDYVIYDTGEGYDESAYIEIDSTAGTGAEIVPIVVEGKIQSIVIFKGGDGYTASAEKEISIKIQDMSDADINDYIKDNDGFIGIITIR